MVTVNKFGERFKPSVHYGRQNITNRYWQNAAYKASLFAASHPVQQTTISYDYSMPKAYVAGAAIGTAANLVANNWGPISSGCKTAWNWISNTAAPAIGKGCKSAWNWVSNTAAPAVGKWFSGAFNTIKGWFGK